MKRLGTALLVLISATLLIQKAYATDTQPPQLIDWQILGSPTADNRNQDSQFKVKFILSDESKIDTPILILKSSTSSQISNLATVEVNKTSGQLTEYTATVFVQKGAAGGKWIWQLYPLVDSLKNQETTFGPDAKWKNEVFILNCDYNTFHYILDKNRSYIETTNAQLRDSIDKLKNLIQLYPKDTKLSLLSLRAPNEMVINTPKPKTCEEAFSPAYRTNLASDQANIQGEPIQNFISEVQSLVSDYSAKEQTERLKSENTQKLNKIIESLEKNIPKLKMASQIREAKNLLSSARQYLIELSNSSDFAISTSIANLETKYSKLGLDSLKTESTVTCIKGKLTKNVTGVNPKCPTGYKKK